MELGLGIKVALALAGCGVLPAAVYAATSAGRKRAEAPAPDPAVQALLAVLPGANCGLCGNASCFDAARAVVSGQATTGVCAAGGERTAEAVARVLRATSSPATRPAR